MLEPIAENLWALDYRTHTLGMPTRLRMTVVRLARGGLWLHSAVPLTDADQRELEALGPVQFIVAPNKFHHLHASAAKQRFPQARLLVAPGLQVKRPQLPVDGVLGNVPEAGYAVDLQQKVLAGAPGFNEVVFFHPASRTLIVTDVVINVSSPPWPWRVPLWLVFGALGQPLQSRVYKVLTRDRAAFRAAVTHVLAWDFDRIVMSHGTVISSGGKDLLRRVTAWAG